jgi:hypothetical protein
MTTMGSRIPVRRCKYCGADIQFFLSSHSGKWLPVDASPVAHDGSPNLVVVVDGNYVICTRTAMRGESVYNPHWLNTHCPNNRIKSHEAVAAGEKAPGQPPAPRTGESREDSSECFAGPGEDPT